MTGTNQMAIETAVPLLPCRNDQRCFEQPCSGDDIQREKNETDGKENTPISSTAVKPPQQQQEDDDRNGGRVRLLAFVAGIVLGCILSGLTYRVERLPLRHHLTAAFSEESAHNQGQDQQQHYDVSEAFIYIFLMAVRLISDLTCMCFSITFLFFYFRRRSTPSSLLSSNDRDGMYDNDNTNERKRLMDLFHKRMVYFMAVYFQVGLLIGSTSLSYLLLGRLCFSTTSIRYYILAMFLAIFGCVVHLYAYDWIFNDDDNNSTFVSSEDKSSNDRRNGVQVSLGHGTSTESDHEKRDKRYSSTNSTATNTSDNDDMRFHYVVLV